MKSDKQKLIELFKELGIQFDNTFDNTGDSITVNKGYPGFFFNFVFDDKGKLIEYGAWE